MAEDVAVTPTEETEPAQQPVVQPEPGSGGDDAPQPQKPRGGFQRRIDELTRERHELARMNERLLDALEKRVPAPSESAPVRGEPKREQFESYEDFVEARAEHRARQVVQQELEASRLQQQRERAQVAQSEAARKWEERVQRGSEKYEDFADVALADDLPISTAMAQAIQGSDAADDIAYYLGKNRAEAKRIFALPPLAAAREIGKLESKITSGPVKRTTSAPAPINPLGGRDTPGDDPSERDDIDTWMKKRSKQLRS